MADKQKGGKGKRKNNGPAEQRYKSELRWDRNKARSTARGEREREYHRNKHKRRGAVTGMSFKRLRAHLRGALAE